MINEYETNPTLNPKLWDGDELHPSLRLGLLKIARTFYKFLEIDVPVLDIILIGSSANYNWTKYSDIDLHVVVNYLDVGDNLHLVNNYMHAKKSVWNLNYPLKYKGMDIELYAQDSNENLHSSVGVFSVLKNKWLTKPNAETISVDDTAIKQKAEPFEYEIDSIKQSDPTANKKIKSIKTRLRKLRQSGLDANGEYSLENMAFKHLRNNGYIERLNRLEQKIEIGRLSIEESLNELDLASMRDKTRDKVKNFVSAMKTESSETKQALQMILQHLNGQKLNAEEWQWVRNQMKDVVKILGLTTLAIAPGGSLVALLAKVLKADNYLLPSSMQKQKEVSEQLIGHVTGTQKLSESDWQNIIKNTGAVTDMMGQWNHPGKCTMIPTPSGGITMKNVPHEVLGIDDTGHAIVMKPEQDYQFPGRNVFEIPKTAQWQTMFMQIQNAIQNGARYAK